MAWDRVGCHGPLDLCWAYQYTHGSMSFPFLYIASPGERGCFYLEEVAAINRDNEWMGLALRLAEATLGQTSPNPAVGAVVVHQGQVLGIGAHLRAGEAHAEVHALDMAGDRARGATLYVTLEPCSHHGRTPPCTERILASGVTKVVVATSDPNPRVAGRGIRQLREAGLEVVTGVREAEAARLNRFFFKWVRSGLPYVTVKTASTLDGKIATATGDSRWVTGEAARERVHLMRHQHDAILVGSGTALADDPQLTTRLPGGGRNPLRIIADSRLRLPLSARVFRDGQAPTLVLTTPLAPTAKVRELEQIGVEVWVLESADGRVPLREALRRLASRGVVSVLAEGGGQLNFSLLQERLVDEVVAFIAPKIIGGAGPTSYQGSGWEKMADALHLREVQVEQIGEDWCLRGVPEYGVST